MNENNIFFLNQQTQPTHHQRTQSIDRIVNSEPLSIKNNFFINIEEESNLDIESKLQQYQLKKKQKNNNKLSSPKMIPQSSISSSTSSSHNLIPNLQQNNSKTNSEIELKTITSPLNSSILHNTQINNEEIDFYDENEPILGENDHDNEVEVGLGENNKKNNKNSSSSNGIPISFKKNNPRNFYVLKSLYYSFVNLPSKTKLILYFLFIIGILSLIFVIISTSNEIKKKDANGNSERNMILSEPVSFDIITVADRDLEAYQKSKKKWFSYLLRGKLTLKPKEKTKNNDDDDDEDEKKTNVKYSFNWFNPGIEIGGKFVEGVRGMELSELKRVKDRLYSCDDRSGIIYEIKNSKYHLLNENQKKKPENQPFAIPRQILVNGDGEQTSKGLKCEWITKKDNSLYVGSIGKPWTDPKTGKVKNYDPMWIKKIDSNGLGKITHLNWVPNFQKLQKAAKVPHPGYMVHEAIEWSDYHKKWFILPRRISDLKYTEVEDIHRGGNILLMADEKFENIETVLIGTEDKFKPRTRGYSTFKFIPGRPNEIIALKSEESEDGKNQYSYITIFNIKGEILYEETKIADEKLEGLEFF